MTEPKQTPNASHWCPRRELASFAAPAEQEAWGPEPTREGEAPCGRGRAV